MTETTTGPRLKARYRSEIISALQSEFEIANVMQVPGLVKDVVNISGFKVSAAEVERVIRELEAIHDCAVVAAPDRLRGESVKAVVTLRPGRTITDDAILTHCRVRLGNRKAPTSVEQWPELPRSPAGKIDKVRIRAMFWTSAPVHPQPVPHP